VKFSQFFFLRFSRSHTQQNLKVKLLLLRVFHKTVNARDDIVRRLFFSPESVRIAGPIVGLLVFFFFFFFVREEISLLFNKNCVVPAAAAWR